ncbi:hypothetical protein X798_01381 [Onchocerca flexuosa]|uniref:Uncharacterized protein n=1 Tax=Onchocerca flexuosa TaxID=387005 RepID=A0A238C245_9BILA|nr:hypothetical protein X798_01381 [Onchocerca flexuosa]
MRGEAAGEKCEYRNHIQQSSILPNYPFDNVLFKIAVRQAAYNKFAKINQQMIRRQMTSLFVIDVQSIHPLVHIRQTETNYRNAFVGMLALSL